MGRDHLLEIAGCFIEMLLCLSDRCDVCMTFTVNMYLFIYFKFELWQNIDIIMNTIDTLK